MMEVFTSQVCWPEGTKGKPHWVYVIADSYEEALATVRRHFPEVRVKSISQQSGPNNPVVSSMGGYPIVVADQEVS
jgi:hypothetical protein